MNLNNPPQNIYHWITTIEFLGILKSHKTKFKKWLIDLIRKPDTQKINIKFEFSGYLKAFINNSKYHFSINMDSTFEYFRFYPHELDYEISIDAILNTINTIDDSGNNEVIICIENNRIHTYIIPDILNYEREIFPDLIYTDEYDKEPWYLNVLDYILIQWESINKNYIKRII